MPPLHSTADTAIILGLPQRRIREMCAALQIETVTIPGPRNGVRYYISDDAINAFIRTHTIPVRK